MQTLFINAHANNAIASNQQEGNVFRLNADSNRNVNRTRPNPNSRRDFMRERMAAQEREMRLQEMENQRIQTIREEIWRIQDSDMSDELISLNVSLLNEQISQIFMTRAEREQVAIEREIQRQQQEMDERMRERERAANENRYTNMDDEELEQALERSNIRNMTAMSARADNIRSLSQTRASMSAEATRLRGEANFDLHRQRVGNQQMLAAASQRAMETGMPVDPGPLLYHNPLEGNFRGAHLQRLNAGISRLGAAINHQIGALYRDSQNMQEEQLRIYREQSRISNPEELRNENEEDDENNGIPTTSSIDLRL
jgi:hypothetical protein